MIRLSISFYGEVADRLGRERVMAFAADDVTVGEIRAELAQPIGRLGYNPANQFDA